jgi:hypothetical protein
LLFFIFDQQRKKDYNMSMHNSKQITADGLFFNTRVVVLDKNEMIIFCDSNITKENFEFDFKPLCDKIAVYLKDEGFITSKMPRVNIKRK